MELDMNKKQKNILGIAILLIIIFSAILSITGVIDGKSADLIIMLSSAVIIILYFVLRKYKS